MPDSTIPIEWLAQGDLDIQAAEILLAQSGPLPVVAFHLQQALEKYLKGFLLFNNRPLQRIHDLEILIQQVIAEDDDFASYLAPCQRITEYYIEARYPVGIATRFSRSLLQSDLQITRTLADLIRATVQR
jgi:HEPN domain-containing protein